MKTKEGALTINIWELTVYICTALFVFILFIQHSGVNGVCKGGIRDLMDGTGNKPFVYRTLVPSLMRGIHFIIPYHTRINNYVADNKFIKYIYKGLDCNLNDHMRQYALASMIMLMGIYMLLIIFIYYFRKLYLLIFPHESRISIFFIPLVSAVCLIAFFSFGYIYDFATLALCTACFVYMKEKKWFLYLLCFILASLNKETSILLALIFVLEYWSRKNMPRNQFMKLVMSQIGIYGIIRIALEIIYINNPGVYVTLYWEYNKYIIFTHYVEFAVIAMVLSAIIFYGWGEKPSFLKHSCIILPILVATMLLWGLIVELRVLYEVYPIIILLFVDTINKIFHKLQKPC